MRCHIILAVVFAMALLAPLIQAAPAESQELSEAEALAAAGQPAYAEQPVEVVDEADTSGSVESAEPKAEISNDYYIDVNDYKRPPKPWWW
ncbi:GH24337 [Drosophila grimshawi]|uniref:GH24337 n=1 Tax=Drosophila grimshawi TaxID=7222 RepID=B4JMG4_DROGR|nr:GH24337 [Drosophila grimshawi]